MTGIDQLRKSLSVKLLAILVKIIPPTPNKKAFKIEINNGNLIGKKDNPANRIVQTVDDVVKTGSLILKYGRPNWAKFSAILK